MVTGSWLGLGLAGMPAFADSGNAHAAAAASTASSSNGNGNGTATAPGQLKKQEAASAPTTSTATAPTTTAATVGDPTQPQPLSNADLNPGGANNGGDCGAYCSTRDGSPSMNGNGKGAAVGKPCAGCVGKADNKNPRGQQPNGTDHNKGYECDANHGIGRTNPAHTGCKTATTPPTTCTTTNSCGGTTGSCTTTNSCGGTTGSCTTTNTCGGTTGSCTSTTTCSPSPPGCVPTPANTFCTTVQQPPSTITSTPPPTTVLGEKLVRTSTPTVQPNVTPSVQPTALPFTGVDLGPLLGTSTSLLLLGGLAIALGRRRWPSGLLTR